MRRLFRGVTDVLRRRVTGHLSRLVDDPPQALAMPLLEAVHRFSPTITLEAARFPPYGRVLFAFRRRDIEEVLQRDDVFSAVEYGRRMHATSGDFFLGFDERNPAYRGERTDGAVSLGKTEARQRDATAAAFPSEIRKRIREVLDQAAEAAINQRSREDRLDAGEELSHLVATALLEQYFGIPDLPHPADPRRGALVRRFQVISNHIFNFFGSSPEHADPAVRAGHAVRRHLVAVANEELERQKRGAAPGATVLGRLCARLAGGSAEDVARTLAGMASGAVVPTTGLFLHAVRRLLRLPRHERDALHVAASNGEAGAAEVRGYVLEAARYSPFPPTVYRVCVGDHVLGIGTLHETRVERGTLVVPVFIGAAFDPAYVQDPWRFNPRRGDGEYLLFGHGPHECLGTYIGEETMTRMAMALFALPGVGRLECRSGAAPKGSRDQLLLQLHSA